MSVEEARRLYETVRKNGQLREEFVELKAEEEILDRALEVGKRLGLNVSREDIIKFHEQLAAHSRELEEKELEKVAGGREETPGRVLALQDWLSQ